MLRSSTSVTTTETSHGSMNTALSFQISADNVCEGEAALSEEELFIDKHAEKEVCKTLDATSVGPYDKKELDEHEQRLNRRNEGRDEDDFSQRMHEFDRERIIEALCSSLPVSRPETEAAKSQFEELELDQFGNQKAVRKVAFATIRHVVDQRRLDHGADWEDLLRESKEYREVKSRVLSDDRGFMKLCSKVSMAIERVPLGPEFSTTIPGRDPSLPESRRSRNRSGQHWDLFSPEAWEHAARNWDSQPEYVREKVPDEYRELIEQLRRWEPWEETNQEEEEPVNAESESNTSEATHTERVEELLDELEKEIEQNSA
jgi:hypothetical protein